ncbi:MAG: hypothetical protein U0792_00785 [Gemmataceae bacterium]
MRDIAVFSAGGDKVVRQHDAASGKLLREYSGHADWIYSRTIHSGSERLACRSPRWRGAGVEHENGRVCDWCSKAAPGLGK